MNLRPGANLAVSLRRIAAIAQLRVRRVIRTRILLVALVLSLLPWAIVEGSALVARLSALATFTVAGLTALAAGAVADDLDDGEYAIVVAHEASPLEMLGGQAAATFAMTALLVALQLPLAFRGLPIPRLVPVMLCIAWLAALLAGWLALMLLLATFLEGKGNAVAMVAVLLLPLALAAGVLERLPRSAAAIVRGVLQVVPQLEQVNAMFRAVVERAPAPAITPVVLIASPILYFTLASIRLIRMQPAGRITR